MVIANPIYDIVFKRLMEDKRVARFFLETLMETTLEDVWMQPQEYTHPEQNKGLALFRLDFIATIKTADGEYKKVLIEIQKAKNLLDLMRFRKYLGEQYKKEDEIQTDKGTIITPLPITTIYLLGFQLPGVESPAVKVAREYIDLITHQRIARKSDFIEKLTHDCYIVQMTCIHGKWHSKLEELLSVFEQDYFVDENRLVKEYKYDITNEHIKRMVEILHYEGTEPERRKEIEYEQEYWRTFYAMAGEGFREMHQKFERSLKTIEENKKALDENQKTIEDNQKALEEKEKALEQNKKAIEQERMAKEAAQQVLLQKEQELEELRRLLGRGK